MRSRVCPKCFGGYFEHHLLSSAPAASSEYGLASSHDYIKLEALDLSITDFLKLSHRICCWARVRRVRQGNISSELLMCGGGVRSILLLSLVARDNRCMYMAQVCFYVCCIDCVGVCGNICCVAAIVKNSIFLS